jgi:hypothetical protein
MKQIIAGVLILLVTVTLVGTAAAHGIVGKDAAFVESTSGPEILAFMYLGAKHMVTGYDHLLFLVGVIFFLYRMRDVGIYVTLFSIGHSITLLAGVLMQINVNAYLVDALIGLSVVYKAFDNLDGFKTVFGFQPDNRIAVGAFGLVHGFGLATKLQALRPSPDGLVTNMIAFNVGVELGQLIALSLILLIMTYWRRTASFGRMAVATNVLLMTAGVALAGQQLAGYFYGA